VEFEESLSEIVLFELPNRYFAERLFTRAVSRRLSWIQDGDEGSSVVGVLLNPDERDLALLLRDVQAWLERWGPVAIRFELDGNMYVLQARHQPALALG